MVFHCIFRVKKAIIITSKQGTRIFFPITILFSENFKNKCPKKRSKIQKSNLGSEIWKDNLKKIVGHLLDIQRLINNS